MNSIRKQISEDRKKKAIELRENGYKVEDIAKILSLSEKTIRRYFKS